MDPPGRGRLAAFTLRGTAAKALAGTVAISTLAACLHGFYTVNNLGQQQ